ncbi:hypothetical protein T439DRAFT_359510 [Meredithblackwellia eburnea MCA 4105]
MPWTPSAATFVAPSTTRKSSVVRPSKSAPASPAVEKEVEQVPISSVSDTLWKHLNAQELTLQGPAAPGTPYSSSSASANPFSLPSNFLTAPRGPLSRIDEHLATQAAAASGGSASSLGGLMGDRMLEMEKELERRRVRIDKLEKDNAKLKAELEYQKELNTIKSDEYGGLGYDQYGRPITGAKDQLDQQLAALSRYNSGIGGKYGSYHPYNTGESPHGRYYQDPYTIAAGHQGYDPHAMGQYQHYPLFS